MDLRASRVSDCTLDGKVQLGSFDDDFGEVCVLILILWVERWGEKGVRVCPRGLCRGLPMTREGTRT